MVKLFKHQKILLRKMERLERVKVIEKDNYSLEVNMGINADPQGSGKCLTMIWLIKNDKMSWDAGSEYNDKIKTTKSGGLITKSISRKYIRAKPTIILLTPCLIRQWQEEMDKCGVSYETVYSNKDVNNLNIEDKEVIILSSNAYNLFVSVNSKYIWKRFIFDEPSSVRIPSMKFIKSGFYWFVTHDPNMISLHHHTCRNGMMKTILGDNWWDFDIEFMDIIFKNSPDVLETSYKLPNVITKDHVCKLDKLMSSVKGMELKGKIIDILQYNCKTFDNCPICLEELSIPAINQNCSHIFCTKCITKWLNISNKCPVCKGIIEKEQLSHIIDKIGGDEKYGYLPTKYEKIIELLKIEDKYTIIWTDINFPKDVELLCVMLSDNNIKYQQLKGSASIKMSSIYNFNIGVCKVLILNENDDILGINLTKATDIMFLNVPNTKYKYVTNKSNRIGRKTSLTTHTFNVMT